jgi:alpha-D-xyloside xylohydrolase
VKAQAPLDKIPLFVRQGSIVPVGPQIQYAEEKTDGTMTLYIYTGKNAEFTLYEDENENNNFQKGMYSTIDFKWDEATQILTIGKRNGSYAGMMNSRSFKIVTVSKEEPAEFGTIPESARNVSYDGEEKEIKR